MLMYHQERLPQLQRRLAGPAHHPVTGAKLPQPAGWVEAGRGNSEGKGRVAAETRPQGLPEGEADGAGFFRGEGDS